MTDAIPPLQHEYNSDSSYWLKLMLFLQAPLDAFARIAGKF